MSSLDPVTAPAVSELWAVSDQSLHQAMALVTTDGGSLEYKFPDGSVGYLEFSENRNEGVVHHVFVPAELRFRGGKSSTLPVGKALVLAYIQRVSGLNADRGIDAQKVVVIPECTYVEHLLKKANGKEEEVFGVEVRYVQR